MGKDLNGKELGSGILQRPNGEYLARFTNRFGKRKCLYGRNLKILKERLIKAQYEDKQEIGVVNERIKLDTLFPKWLEDKTDIRANTIRDYTYIYEKLISPTLGKCRLNVVKNSDIKKMIKSLEDQGYHYTTKNKVKILLSDMYNMAIQNDYATKNPAQGIKISRDEKKDPRFLSLEEQSLFFDCCKGTFYDNLFTVAVETGLRPGELCAITKSDIDLEKEVIKVTKSLLYQKLETLGDEKKEFHIGPPKTKSSYREVPLSERAIIALKKQFIQDGVVKKNTPKTIKPEFEDLLFTTRYATPICSQTYKDAIEKIVNEINLMRSPAEQIESFSAHTFRHTFASNCYFAGHGIVAVQRLLGHANISMTTNLYIHIFKEMYHENKKNQDLLYKFIEFFGNDMTEKKFKELMVELKDLEDDEVELW